MVKYGIYRGNSLVEEIKPTGPQQRAVMGVNIVNLRFDLNHYTAFQVGDFVDVYGERYTIRSIPTVEKNASNGFSYAIEFVGMHYQLADVAFNGLDSANQLTALTFPLVADASTVIDLVVKNANRISSGWKKGIVDATEAKLLSFSKENCLMVLARLAEEYKNEFWVDSDKSIHLTTRAAFTGLTFEYGINKGLYTITRNTSKTDIITRLYVEGSEKNLPAGYPGGKLRLPGGLPYLERNVSKYGVREGSQTFDIFPKRIGTVTAVGDINVFYDSTLDFDINLQLVPETSVKVEFQTGQLAGYTFEIKKDGYSHAEKKITLLSIKDDAGINVPTALIRPKVGDKYLLFDLIMPPSYVSAGESDVQVAGQKYLEANSDQVNSFTVACDPKFFQDNNITVPLGGTVRLMNAPLGTNELLRVIGVTRDVESWNNYQIELSETVAVAPIIRELLQAKELERVVEINQLLDVNRTRRNKITMEELRNSLVDFEGNYYSDKIRPLSIETQMLTVGSRAQSLTLAGVSFVPNYKGNPSRIRVTGGVLTHFLIDDAGPRSWVIADYGSDSLAADSIYYIYARCEKIGSQGVFVFDNDAIAMEGVPNYYHFPIGVLHKVLDGYRRYSLTYGSVDIYGRTISAGRIQSQDGRTFFDIDQSKIGGDIEFVGADGTYKDIDELMADALASYQPDNQVIVWDYDYDPSLTNYPASSWTTVELKDAHVNDLFYNTLANTGWKFTKTVTSYSWLPETNAGLIKAMKKAAQAQDTADHKRRNFTGPSTPVPPYDVDDQWSPGVGGYTQYCIVAKGEGQTYAASDWSKSDKATDDGTAIIAQNAANTANTRLAQIASDNVLAKEEKATELKEWQAIQGEKANIDAQAAKYGVSAADYDAAYNNLSTYITPLLSNLTTDSTIVGATYRSIWIAYYNERTALLKDIAIAGHLVEKARLGTSLMIGGYFKNDLIDTGGVIIRGMEEADAQSAVNSILDIGDRNLVLESGLSSFAHWSINGTATRSIVSDGGRNVTRVNSTAGNDGIYQFISSKPGRKYSASVEVKALTNPQSILIGIFPTAPKAFTVAPADGWVKIKTTEAVSANDIAITIYAGAGRSFLVRDAKLQEGSTVTTYTPSPEDVDVAIQGKVDALETSLGGMAYEDLVRLALLDSSLIVGGYFKNTLIDTEFIKALEFLFTKGKIGDWNINANGITNSNGKSYIKQTSPNSAQTNITIGVQSLINTVFDKTRNSGVDLFNNEPNHNPSPSTNPVDYQNFGAILGAGNSDDDVALWLSQGALWLSGQFRPQWNVIDHPNTVSSIILPDYVHYIVIKPAINGVAYLPQKPKHFTQLVIKIRHSTLNWIQVKPHPTGTASSNMRDITDSLVSFIQIDRTTRALTLFFDGPANEWTVFDR